MPTVQITRQADRLTQGIGRQKARRLFAKFKQIHRPEVAKDAPGLGPPPKRNRAEFPLAGTIEIPGLPLIRIETPKGDYRRGVDRAGKKWEVKMPAHYGEFAGTEGTDGDPLDVFVGPDVHSPWVYVVHAQDPVARAYDEDKVMVGFPTKAAALGCFLKAYTKPGFKGGIRKLSFPRFIQWLNDHGKDGAKITVGEALKAPAIGLRWED